MADIQHNINEQCFFLELDGHKAFVSYEIYDNALDIRKTLVPEVFRGQGIAGKLVKTAYDYAVQQNLKCLATCSYAVTWLERHPNYQGQVSSDYIEGGCAIAKHKS